MTSNNTKAKLNIAIILSGTFLVMLNQQLLSPALPAIMDEMGVGATTVQWLQSAYAMIIAILVPLSAFFLGKLSTRKLFILALVIFGIGSLLCALAPAFGVILAGRMIQACSAGVLLPMCITMLMLSFPKEKRGTAMGVSSLVMGVAPALGPALSGIFVDHFSWRAIFILGSVLAAIVILLAVAVLKNMEGFEKSSFDLPSVILSSLGLLGILYGLSTFSEPGKRLMSVGVIVAGIIILTGFARRQMRLQKPLLNVRTLGTRCFRVSAIAPGFMQAVLYGSMVLMPIYIQNVLGESATVSGLVLMPGAILGAVVAYISGRLFDRHGVRRLALTGGAMLAISGIGLALLPEVALLIPVVCAYALLAVSMQVVVTPLKTWGLNSLDNSLVPHGTPIQNTFVSVGGSLGTAMVVSIGALAGSQYMQVHLGFICMAVFALAYFLMMVVFVKEKR
ncbi:MAG: DHA2 family efflux MFS transporter permease subunit [Bacillota bacterium]|nr:DHA2 family efflux MFS transporter permease subunit [Bacillota bacterium]